MRDIRGLPWQRYKRYTGFNFSPGEKVDPEHREQVLY
jgi:hypothetical protein